MRLRSSSRTGAAAPSSSGTNSQQAAYRIRPAPPKKISTTRSTRTITGSMSRWRPRPPATPAIVRSVVERRSRDRSRTSAPLTRGPSLSSGASGGVVVMGPAWRREGAGAIGEDPGPGGADPGGLPHGRGVDPVRRWSGHDPDPAAPRPGAPRAAPGLPRHPGPRGRRSGRRPGAPPGRAGAVGAGRRSWSAPRPVDSGSSCTPGCGWCCRPTPASSASAPGLEGARRDGRRPGRRRRRLGDVGQAVALGALALGVLLDARGRPRAGRRSCGRWSSAWSASRCCGARRTRRSASAGSTRPARIAPLRVVLGSGRLGVVRPRGPGPPAWSGGARAGGPAAAAAGAAAARPVAGHPARSGRHRGRGRPVGLPPGLRPDRGARGAGAQPGARRRRRPPARLGPADPRADPALRRRRPPRWPGWPAARSATCAPGCSGGGGRREHRRPARCAPRPLRSRTPTTWHVDVVAVGDAALDETLRPVVAAAGEALGNAARHAGVPRVDVYAEVDDARRRGLRARPRARLRPRRGAGRPHGVRRSIIDRMQRHGGTAEVRTTPGAGTEVRLRLPRTPQEDQ